MPAYLEPLEVPGNSRSPANSALGLGSSVPLRNPYHYSRFDYNSYGKIATGDPPKRSKPIARQRIERVVHEKAPHLATLVAGHGDGGLKQAAKDVRERAVNNITAGKSRGRSKRYSSSEKQHLVEDESGELHDPEYESFRLVQNPSAQHSRNSRSNGGSDDDDSVSETSEETEDEAVASVRQKQAELMNGKTSLNRPPLPSASRSGTGPGQPSRSYRGSSTHAPMSASHRTSNVHPSGSAFGSILAGSLASSRRGTPSIRSRISDGSDRPEKRAGGVTYLAPSITMPPVASSYASTSTIQPQAYNPYTYVPTTTTNAQAYSHSPHIPFVSHHASKRHNVVTSSTPMQRTYGQSSSASVYPASIGTAGTAGSVSGDSGIAPPIAWNSTFTPSAEHPERHRTRQHDSSATDAIKRSFQAAKLDVTFGLLRLGKKQATAR